MEIGKDSVDYLSQKLNINEKDGLTSSGRTFGKIPELSMSSTCLKWAIRLL